MLETVREFAADRLEECGEAEGVRRRHAEYFLGLAERARGRLRGPEGARWLNRLEGDHDNLRKAIDWGEATGDRDGGPSGIEIATRIAAALAWFWMLRSHLRQGRERVERLRARAASGTAAHARALLAGSALARYMGDADAALRLADEGLAEWTALGDRRQVAVALARVGDAHGRLGAFDRARELLEECAALSGDVSHTADLEYSIVVMQAQVAWAAGDLESAKAQFEQGIALGRSEGDTHSTLISLRHLGLLAEREGDLERARRLLAEAVGLARELGDQPCSMFGLAGLAYVAAAADQPERAVRLLAAVGGLHEVTGFALARSTEAGGFDQVVAALRTTLAAEWFTAAWDEGRAMGFAQAVAYALEETVSA
jgi:non-specific serine/threonine protein kinase